MRAPRRSIGLLLTGILTCGAFVVLPVVGGSAAAPVPVAPVTTTVDLSVVPAPQTNSRVRTASLSTTSPDVVLEASAEASGFAVVGVVWDDVSDGSVPTVEMRSRIGDDWTAWEVMPSEPSEKDPEPGAPETKSGTEPVVVGDVDEVEVRMTADAVPEGASLSVIDPGESAADAQPTAPPAAAFANGGPTVLPRAAWGADESLMQWTPRQGKVTGAVIHHTAGSNAYSAEQVPSILRGIYAYHAQSRGWGDIGYNFLVDKFGRAWEGRAGGITMATTGAHAVNYNSAMTGISVIGDYSSTAISGPAWDTVADLTAWKLSIHGVRTFDSTSVNGGAYPAIVGHRDVGQTACPGQQIYGRMGELRNYIAQRQMVHQGVFGTALGNFVKTQDDSTVYLVSGSTRHPVQDWSTLEAYGSLGNISVASSTYVSSLAKGSPLGRFARNSTTGDVYFVDSSIRLRVPTCGIVSDYGSTCASAVNLTPAQLARLTNGPQMTRGYVTTNGKLFYVENGSRREALDGAAVLAAGIKTEYVRLSESGIARLPYGPPILRPDVVVRDRASGAAYLHTDSRLIPASGAVVDQSALRALPAGRMDATSLQKVTQSGSLVGYVRPAQGAQRYLVTTSGLLDVSGQPGVPDATFTVLNANVLASLGTVARTATTFVRSSSNPQVLKVDGAHFRPVLALQDLVDLAGTSSPRVLFYPDAAQAALPVGPAIPSPGTLVKSPASPQVYVVDGYTGRVPLEVFDVSQALGLGTSVTTLPTATIDALKVRTTSMSPFIDCNGWSMVGARGRIHPQNLGSAAGTGLPSTKLTAQTCGRLPIDWSTLSGPVFVKAAGQSNVYQVVGGRKQLVTSWSRVVTLAGTHDPLIHVLGPAALAAMP